MGVDAVGTSRRGRGVRKAIRQKRNTKMFYAETIGNPGLEILNLPN